MKTLYYNCPAGISGDMNLAAMVDLGVDPARLVAELRKLDLDDWEISFTRDRRKGVSGTRCDVRYKESHHHRTFADIRGIIERAALDDAVKADAIAVFRALAEAEGAVHDKPADAVHFHEVGAVDSILDIVGAAVCWHILGVGRIAASTVELGSGTVRCAHGRMPVPAPATARLVAGFPVSVGGASGEATTPTGAALLAGRKCVFGEPLQGRAGAAGIGVGHRDEPDIANVLYATLLDPDERSRPPDQTVLELAVNLDDMSPEKVAFLAETLLDAGALDVWQTPAAFKKGRMGCVLSALIQPDARERVTGLLFRHSTTLGIRWRPWNRAVLERESAEVETPLGTVRVKTARPPDGPARAKVEYEDLRRLAREHHLSIPEIEAILSKSHVPHTHHS
jgi:pyridinium-3,5-bisthiocarboxylic acid mononucleotide nickel chelatase